FRSLNFGNCQNYEQALKLDKPTEGFEVTWFLVEGDTETEIGVGEEIVYDFGAEGLYNVRAEISSEECTVVAEDLLNVVLGVTVPRDTIDLCIGGNIQINPVTYDGYTYRWLDAGLVSDVNDPSPVVEVTETTLFEVEVTDKNDPTCVDTGFVLVRIDELQLAEYSAFQDLCAAELTVQFTPSAQGVVETHWVFFIGGEAVESTDRNPTITFPSTGFYEVQLTVVTTLGCEAVFSKMVEVFDPATDLTIVNFGNCENYEQVLRINHQVEGYEIIWTLVGGESETPMGTGTEISYDFGAEGIYTVRAELSSPECTITVQADLDVVLGVTVPRDTIDICVLGNIQLNPVAYEGYAYRWLNEGLISDVNDPSPTVEVTETTLFEVVVTDRNDPDCVDTGFVLVRVNELPIGEFEVIQDLCAEGYVVEFRPTASDLSEVSWTFIMGGVPVHSSELNPTISYSAPGFYEVTLAAMTAAGCVDTVTRIIEVFDPATDLGIINFGNCENYEQVLKLNKNIQGYEITWTLIDG